MRAGVCWKPDSSLFSVNNPSRSAEDPHAFDTTLSFCREPSTGHSVRQHQTVHHSLALLLHSGTHCQRPPSFFSQLLLSDQRSNFTFFPQTRHRLVRAHVCGQQVIHARLGASVALVLYQLLLTASVWRYSPLSPRSHAILHEWLAFYSAFLNIHRSGVLTVVNVVNNCKELRELF